MKTCSHFIYFLPLFHTHIIYSLATSAIEPAKDLSKVSSVWIWRDYYCYHEKDRLFSPSSSRLNSIDPVTLWVVYLFAKFLFIPSPTHTVCLRTSVPKEDSQIIFDETHVSSYVVNPFSGRSPFRQIGAQLILWSINQSLNRSHGLPVTEDWDLTQSNPQTNQ